MPSGKHGVIFAGGKSGTFTVYLRIRHAAPGTTSLWTSRNDTRAGRFIANEFLTHIEMRGFRVKEVV